jgi:(E)-4-hydroxy-3-methylbut-2-enyl-diphosphate synthase
MIKRRTTRTVKIGNIKVGSGYPVAIQTMVKVKAKDTDRAVEEINKCAAAGCEIVRIAIEDLEDAQSIKTIKRRICLPLVADIHFDYRLALAAIEAGSDKIRLNPGNIFKSEEVRAVIAAAKSHRTPIRIGANSGSLRMKSKNTAQALVQSVLDYLKIFKKENFHNIVISLKASHRLDTIEAYEKMARVCDYPFHLGLTATGLPLDGVVKSSAALGVLLFKGIGDTIRISLLQRPEVEVAVGQLLLNSLGLRKFGPEWICCPTCGRCEVDLLKRANNLKGMLGTLSVQERNRIKNYKIALMGCVVNGPGEAREATWGIAFSKTKAALFKKGKIFNTVRLDVGEKSLFKMLKKDLRSQ